MNPYFRKVALIAASLGLLLSLFVALRPDDDEEAAPTTTAQTTTEAPPATTAQETTTAQTTTETQPATTASSGPGTVHINYAISGGRPEGGIARDSVARGRIVVIRVTSDVVDEVHVHGYDVSANVAPRKPTTIRFTASAPGRFEIELEDRGVQIAELEVRP